MTKRQLKDLLLAMAAALDETHHIQLADPAAVAEVSAILGRLHDQHPMWRETVDRIDLNQYAERRERGSKKAK